MQQTKTTSAFEVFCDLLEIEPAERQPRLAALHAQDANLADEIESLLRAHSEAATTFLVQPARDSAGALLESSLTPTLEGRMVGSYRLINEIGRGGMGSVWLAERADGEFEQRVAVKLVRGQAAPDDMVRRFRHERQVLANLEHPNIAHLIDGGSFDLGEGVAQPYLVMEYVEGEPIDQYCDANRRSLRERISLFRSVCAAVQHAHRNLVVHRDLKPGNILVTDEGVVKLLDFGIAKIIGDAAAAEPTATMTVERRLTPAYASPEQVRGEAVSTATDVYSLGVILYELLTGARPYEFPTSVLCDVDAIICETPPRRPSTAIETKPETGSGGPEETQRTWADFVSERRSTVPSRLRKELQGDLENILLMALRKEPERRYASVVELDADLRRYLESEPVLAHADSRWYRARKFVLRHRPLVASAVAVAVVLLGGIAATTSMYLRSQANLTRALDAEIRAEDRLTEATLIGEFLEDMIQSVNPLHAEGRDVGVLRDVLEEASRKVHETAARPTVEARLRTTIGGTYVTLSLHDEGRPHIERALQIWDSMASPPSSEVAKTCLAASMLASAEGRHEDAAAICRRGLEQPIAADYPEDAKERQELVHALGASLIELNRIEAARALVDRGIELELARRAPRRVLLGSLYNLDAVLHVIRGDLDEGERRMRRALETLREEKGPDHPNVLAIAGNIAKILRNLKRFEEAEEIMRGVIASSERVFGPEHQNHLRVLESYANVITNLDRMDEAEAIYRDVIATQRRVFGERGPDLDVTLNNLADLLRRRDRPEEAVPLLREALALALAEHGESHPGTAIVMGNLGATLLDLGGPENLREAEGQLQDAWAIMRGALPPGHPHLVRSYEMLATLYDAEHLNQPDRSESIRAEMAVLRPAAAPGKE